MACTTIQPLTHLLSVRLQSDCNNSSTDKNIFKSLFPSDSHTPIWVQVPLNHNTSNTIDLPKLQKFEYGDRTDGNPSTATRRGISSTCAKDKSANKGVIYRFKSAYGNAQLKFENIKAYTALIKEEWASASRAYIKSGCYVRRRANRPEFLTFEGNSPGLLQAFTPGKEDAGNVKYSMETNIAKEVCAQITQGTKIRIGKNGEALPGNYNFGEISNFYVKCDHAIDMTKNQAQKHEPLHVPLSLEDVEKRAKVLTPRACQSCSLVDEVTNTSVPIVYNDPSLQIPYKHPSEKADGGRLSKLLAQKLASVKEKQLSMVSYEEVLESYAPKSAQNGNDVSLNSSVKDENSDITEVKTTEKQKPVAKHFSNLGENRNKTLELVEDIRSTIQRQVTVPSRTIVSPRKVKSRRGSLDSSEPFFGTRPPKYVPAYRNKQGTTSVEEKEYLKFSHPLSTVDNVKPTINYRQSVAAAGSKRSSPVQAEEVCRSSMPVGSSIITFKDKIVGKPPVIEHIIRTPIKNSRTKIPSTPEHQMQDLYEELSSHATGRVTFSIPQPDMLSVSSTVPDEVDPSKGRYSQLPPSPT